MQPTRTLRFKDVYPSAFDTGSTRHLQFKCPVRHPDSIGELWKIGTRNSICAVFVSSPRLAENEALSLARSAWQTPNCSYEQIAQYVPHLSGYLIGWIELN